MKNESCIFCKIAAGEIPGATLYENGNFRVVLDVNPASKGHCLVLPKDHYANIFEMPEELTAEAFVLAGKIARKLKEVTGADGINVLQNNGEAAGQTVFHFHIHLIPRFDDDGVGLSWKQGELTEKVKEEMLEEFRLL